MINKWMTCVATCLALAGCDGPNTKDELASDNEAKAPTLAITPTYKGFRVSVALDLDPNELPPDNDLLMAENISEFAGVLCGIGLSGSDTMSRCDVYARPVTTGSLGGYIAIIQRASGVTLNSSLSLAQQPERKCTVEGKLWTSETGDYLTNAVAGSDFSARIHYSAWESGPGDWRVSFDDGTGSHEADNDGANGVWYLDRQGNNLRLERERWSYCYTDTSTPVDDVYRRILTFEPA